MTIHGATIKDYALVGMGITILDHAVIGEGQTQTVDDRQPE